MLNKYNFYISSAQRTSGTPSNFNIKLNSDITLSKEIKTQFRVFVHSATIPFSFYQWNEYNYTTQFNLQQDNKNYTGSFNIPPGNYNIRTFATAWIASLETQLGVVASYFPNITYTYDNDTNFLNFTLPFDGSNSIITFYNNAPYKAVNLALGFGEEWTLTEDSSTTSTQQCDISPARNLYLYSNIMSSPTNYEALTSKMTTSTQLCSIPINCAPNNYIIYTPFNRLISTVGNKSFSQFNFQLQSEDLDVNLTNFVLNWSMVFVIEEWRIEDPMQSLVDITLQTKEQELNRELEKLKELKKQLLISLDEIKKNETEKLKSLTNDKDEKSNENRTSKKDRREKGFVNTIPKRGKQLSKATNDSNTTRD